MSAADDRQEADGEQRQRIDKWLFFARAVKSRSLAAKLVAAGHVRVNRDKTDQPSRPVKPGDVLTIALDRKVLVWRVVAPGARRRRRRAPSMRISARRTGPEYAPGSFVAARPCCAVSSPLHGAGKGVT